MTTIRAIALQTELSNRNGNIVADNQQTALVNILLIEPIAHSITAQVHIRGRLEQEHLPTLQRGLGHKTIAFILKNDIGRLSKSVQYHPSCIVAGLSVFVARIAQPNNKILVHNYSAAASAAAEREARVALTEQTITSLEVAISRPSKLSEPTLMALPSCRSVTSMSSFSGICL